MLIKPTRHTHQPVAFCLGTRPEIIKLAPLIRLTKKRKTPFFIIHTGQHYSFELDRIFFKELCLPEPAYQLSSASKDGRHGEHTARMLKSLEAILLDRMPRALLVQGDTNTVLAGSLAAAKIPGIALGHVEAGLRSYDRQMPEETNRVISDHVSDLLFAPTQGALKTLIGEGVARRKIFVTGNTIVDAVRYNLKLAKKQAGKKPVQPYFLMTLHRQETVDSAERLQSIFLGLSKLNKKTQTPVLFLAHPRTRKRLAQYHIHPPNFIRLLKPVGFLEFLRLENSADLILTDSGGVQEEGCILGVPCVTIRTTTERPETVAVGANVVAGYDSESILGFSEAMLKRKRDWINPYGDGHASERILKILQDYA